MNLPRDEQRHLGDLRKKSLAELKDLLDRQEKIISRKKFLASLPDKGEKTRVFTEKLRNLVAEVSGRMPQPKGTNLHQEDIMKDGTFMDRENETINTLVTRNEENTSYHCESREQPIKEDNSALRASSPEDITQHMQKLSVGTNNLEEEDGHYINSYQRVIKKAELDPSTDHLKFVPNRPLKSKISIPSAQEHSQILTSLVKEESAVRLPVYKHQSSKMISIEESIQLIQEQKKRAEHLAAERAAQRLAEQLSTKMEVYQPSTVDMRYRQSKDEEDQDSDDFPSDEDDNDDESGRS